MPMSDSPIRPRSPVDLDVKSGSPTEVELALLQAQTRRHFFRNLGAGLGTVFLGTLASKLVPFANAAGAETAVLDFSRDPRTPLSPLPPQFPAKRFIANVAQPATTPVMLVFRLVMS